MYCLQSCHLEAKRAELDRKLAFSESSTGDWLIGQHGRGMTLWAFG